VQLSLDETLDDPSRGQRIFFEPNFAINYMGVRLNEDLPRLQKGQIHATDTAILNEHTNFFRKTVFRISPSHPGIGWVNLL
jgi:hypothetical protein